MSVNKKNGQTRPLQALSELREGEHGILESIDLPERLRRRLMELGFLPGAAVTAARSAPGGDPRVFRVDGSEVALRLETAACMRLRTAISAAWGD
jgi:ferrous iron transport protein A